MRVYLLTPGIEREITTSEAAERFIEWLLRDDSGDFTDLLMAWFAAPDEFGGLGAEPESVDDVTAVELAVTQILREVLADRN